MGVFQFQFNPIFLTALLSPIFLWYLYITFLKPRTKANLPPSPPKLPIIGNLHQLGPLSHQDLYSLAKTHGSLMLLHFGSVPVLVVSSAEMAQEITKTHDVIFSDRPHFKATKKLVYGCRNVAFSTYGEYWRQVKSILVLQLLGNKRVQSSRSTILEETALFVKKVRESSGAAVDLSAMFSNFAVDGISRVALGTKSSESELGKKFIRVTNDVMELVGAINIGDFIPWLGWIDRVNGFDKKLDKTAAEIEGVCESLIEERGTKERSGEDFVDILLEIHNDKANNAAIDRDSIKALLMDVFIGGTDTMSTSMEWAMSELLHNPTVREKLQKEVRGIVKEREEIRDDDLEKMHYLKAVIKEALRCHPPIPLLVPRLSTKHVLINGFDIAAGTVVMINAWAIGRDPVSWDEPEKFKPERFINSSIDFKGKDFKLIPFGAGRRGCPGISFANAAMDLLLANLMQKFDWKLPNGVEGKDLDMSEAPGLTVHRIDPLLAVGSYFLH